MKNLKKQTIDELKDSKSDYIKMLNDFQNYIQKEYFDESDDEGFNQRGFLIVAVDNVSDQEDRQVHLSYMGEGSNLLNIVELLAKTHPFDRALEETFLRMAIKSILDQPSLDEEHKNKG